MADPSASDVIVIGAGLSGLSTAYLLQRQGYRVAVLEKAARAGGAIRSWREDGNLVEAGPNSTLETNPLLTQLITDLGLDDRKMYASDASKNRYILRDGQLIALPMSPPAFFATKLFSWGAKLRLFAEPFIGRSPVESQETVADFVQRRLGREFLDYAINPFVAGVYAGDPAQLSVRAAFPKLYELEQKYGGLIKGQIRGARERKKRNEESKQSARMFTFRDGMQTLTDTLAAEQRNMHCGVTVDGVSRGGSGYVVHARIGGETRSFTSRALVIAASARGASLLSRELAPELSEVFSAIPYPPVAVVASVYRRRDGMHPLDGFGFLIPAAERRRILGTIFTSTIFEDRTTDGSVMLTSFAGGMRQPELARQEEDAIVRMVLDEQSDLLGTPAEPDFVRITRWERAIPQYTTGHLERMAKIEAVEARLPGLHFCANYRGGISVADCVKSAHATVDDAAAFLRAS
jgi:oxygen-dependent protoporphyrinogen oxidase